MDKLEFINNGLLIIGQQVVDKFERSDLQQLVGVSLNTMLNAKLKNLEQDSTDSVG